MSMIRVLGSSLSKEGLYAAFAAIGPATLGLWVYSRYQARGLWYDEYGSDDAILIAVIVGTVATFAAVGNFLDSKRRKFPLWWVTPIVIMLGSALFIAASWVYPWPSLDGVRDALAASDLDRAAAELDALEARDPGSPEILALRARLRTPASTPGAAPMSADDHRLSEAGGAALPVATTLVLRRTWQDPDKQATARRRVLERAEAIADDAWARGDGPALAQLLDDTAGLDDGFTRRTTERAALAYARTCLDERRLACVREALAKLDGDESLEPTLQKIREGIEGELADLDESSSDTE